MVSIIETFLTLFYSSVGIFIIRNSYKKWALIEFEKEMQDYLSCVDEEEPITEELSSDMLFSEREDTSKFTLFDFFFATGIAVMMMVVISVSNFCIDKVAELFI